MSVTAGRVKVTCPRCRGEVWTDLYAVPEPGPTSGGDMVLHLSVGPIEHDCEALPLAPDAIIELPPHAVLVYRRLGDPELLVNALKELGRTDVLVIDLDGRDVAESVAALDEDLMAQRGWVRAADVNRE